MDKFFALIGLLALSPIILVIVLLLALFQQGNVFFIQYRSGKIGVIFRLVKFKTMNDRCDNQGKLLTDSKRLTPVGKFIRKTSLDELPQLINVLKGDMSLIGPRPLLVKYLPLYSVQQSRRHDVRPGITGWAQVSGRNAISWQRKFELDVWYVNNLSLWLDLKILALTIRNVLLAKGVNEQGKATVQYFKGNG